MEQTKPQRRTNIFDYWNVTKKIKVMEEPISVPKKPITTRLEDLPNELFYEIFNYLDIYHTYKAFYSLNIRLQSLLTNSNLPLKINISSMSKSNFQRYHRHMIMPNKHRITSMCLSNPFVVDYIFSPVRITSHFTRLETLVFNQIKSKYFLNILHRLASLPNLSSLTIIPIDNCQNLNDIYLQIFRLPALKYFKISATGYFGSNLLPISSMQTSPIEHLVIDCDLRLNDLLVLLSYVPQLHRLTCHSLDGYHLNQFETFSMVTDNLIYVSLDMTNISFDVFELMIKNLFYKLQVLQLSIKDNQEYLNANRWEQLIRSFMPDLRIFDLQFMNPINGDNEMNQEIYDSVLNQFSSLFWYERKWFFRYQFVYEGYRNQVIFFSINPYRRKQYTLYKSLIENVSSSYQRSNDNVVNHLHIRNDEAMISCPFNFRNVTKLTLWNGLSKGCLWLDMVLKRMICLNQLTTLVIKYYDFSFERCLQLLCPMRNLHTLAYDCRSIDAKTSMSIQQSELFRLVSSTNIITTLTIKEAIATENIKIFAALCPRVQHLTTEMYPRNFLSIVELLLLKSKTDLLQLCSLRMGHISKLMIGKVKHLIESEALLDNYLLKYIGHELYLWW